MGEQRLTILQLQVLNERFNAAMKSNSLFKRTRLIALRRDLLNMLVDDHRNTHLKHLYLCVLDELGENN